MPGDVAAGCLELVFRAVLEFLFHGLGEWIWWWFQVSGAFFVFVITFGRVNLMDRHEVLAGLAGIAVHAGVIALVIWQVTEHSEASA